MDLRIEQDVGYGYKIVGKTGRVYARFEQPDGATHVRFCVEVPYGEPLYAERAPASGVVDRIKALIEAEWGHTETVRALLAVAAAIRTDRSARFSWRISDAAHPTAELYVGHRECSKKIGEVEWTGSGWTTRVSVPTGAVMAEQGFFSLADALESATRSVDSMWARWIAL